MPLSFFQITYKGYSYCKQGVSAGCFCSPSPWVWVGQRCALGAAACCWGEHGMWGAHLWMLLFWRRFQCEICVIILCSSWSKEKAYWKKAYTRTVRQNVKNWLVFVVSIVKCLLFSLDNLQEGDENHTGMSIMQHLCLCLLLKRADLGYREIFVIMRHCANSKLNFSPNAYKYNGIKPSSKLTLSSDEKAKESSCYQSKSRSPWKATESKNSVYLKHCN